jgi:starch-binding outer membrane protein, SusD/RagB family
MKKYLPYAVLILFITSCESLDVENTDAPSRTKLFENPRDLKIFAENIYSTYWSVMHGNAEGNPNIGSLTAADQLTASWLTMGCFDLSQEPRVQWNNSPTYEYQRKLTYGFYANMYTVLYMSNTIIGLIKGGSKVSSDPKINAGFLSMCYFIQGAALGQLGLTFDKAQVVKEYTDLKNLVFIPYNQVLDSAITSLKKSISISDTSTFNLGTNIINGVTLDNTLLNKICNSYIARFMVLGSRNKSENSAVDWPKVIEYVKKGITTDFGPIADAKNWVDYITYYITNVENSTIFYNAVDCRLIHLMDPAYPSRFWKNGKPKIVHTGLKSGEASSIDNRLKTYFEFKSGGITFYYERGTYHYSNYRFKRYDYLRTSGIGQMIDISQAESYLYLFEAYAMTDQLDKASGLNTGFLPRMTNYPNLNAFTDKKEALDAIFYEREIELLGQGYLIGFCDMRRRDMLQKGTPLHFPVPGIELQTLDLENYTFGGVNNADGTNTSNGGWE